MDLRGDQEPAITSLLDKVTVAGKSSCGWQKEHHNPGGEDQGAQRGVGKETGASSTGNASCVSMVGGSDILNKGVVGVNGTTASEREDRRSYGGEMLEVASIEMCRVEGKVRVFVMTETV